MVRRQGILSLDCETVWACDDFQPIPIETLGKAVNGLGDRSRRFPGCNSRIMPQDSKPLNGVLKVNAPKLPQELKPPLPTVGLAVLVG